MATLSLVAPAQEANNATVRDTPQVVIRTETRLVLVDAIVRDKRGKIVSDLGAGGFRLCEDGREQPITSFSTEGTGSQEASQTQYVVFFVNTLVASLVDRVAVERDAAQGIAFFAGAYASPNLYMAVATFDGDLRIAQNLTANPDRVRRAAADIARYDTGYERHQAMGSGPAIAVLADSMAGIRGRKSVIVLGELDYYTWKGEDAVARACNRANVAVYSTDPNQKTLAEETGGRLIRDFGEVVADQEGSYVLGFKPVESPDGSCHSLRVQATRSGLEVRARNAYCNVKAPDPLAGLVKGKDLEARASGSSSGNAAASMELPYFYSSPGVAVVGVAMDIDLASLKFTKQNGKQHADLNLVALAYGTDGEVAGRFSDTAPLDFETTQEADAFRKQPYRYEHQFDLPSGRYNVRVAFNSGDQTFGKVEKPLMIDPWDGQHLSLSGIALAAEARKVSDLTSDLDPSLLEGHKRLIAKSTEISPSGSNRFRRSEPCFGYLEIYEPLLAGPNPPTINLEMRILDRRTGEQKVAGAFSAANYIRPGNPVVPVPLKVPIESLPPGPYRLEVKAVRSPGDASVVRAVDFEVEE